jgi:hypothetical protein
MFFVSTWVLMVFIGIASKNLGIHPIGYGTSMVVTIGLWLAVAPAIGAVSRWRPAPTRGSGSTKPTFARTASPRWLGDSEPSPSSL